VVSRRFREIRKRSVILICVAGEFAGCQAVSIIFASAGCLHPLMLSPGFSFYLIYPHPQIGHHVVEQVKFNADQRKLTSPGSFGIFPGRNEINLDGTQDYSWM